MAKINSTKVIVIIGPTASGKSDLALRFALWLPSITFRTSRSERIAKQSGINGAEIISADSRQVYRGMDIGTGKVARDKATANNQQTTNYNNKKSGSRSAVNSKHFYSSGIRHYLIDVASPKKIFTASDFKRLGEKAIKEIAAKNKIPIIVGGTGFYIDVLLGRMSIADVPPNKKLRARFDKLTVEQSF